MTILENRITRVTVRNYRSLEDVTVDLDDLTVLVGPNGSGKSNFVDMLNFVSVALRQSLQNAKNWWKRGTIWNLRRSNPKNYPFATYPEIEIKISLQLGEQIGGYELIFNQEAVRLEHIYLDNLDLRIRNGILSHTTLSGLSGLAIQANNLTFPLIGNLPEFKPLYDFLTKIRIYSIFPDALVPFHHHNNIDHLEENGENLASMYYPRTPPDNAEWKKKLGESLKQLVPGVGSTPPYGNVLGGNVLDLYLKHEDGNVFNLKDESDGTIRVLTLLTALYQEPSLPLIGLEEPELMIHPGALAILSDIIVEASQRGQIIITTHSPDLISRFPANSLRIVEHIDGVTKIGPLTEDQRDVINQKLFSGGDLLRIEGLRRREQ